ncbi:MAG: CDP-alcohol phosphatidyltransferase family protein [Coriobacteriales bacterium]
MALRDIKKEQQEASDKVLTAPNVITFCRLMLIPLFIYLRFFTVHRTAALVVFAIAACTDWVDGQVARRTGQVSKIGKVFDPLVDRFLLATGVISVCVEGHLPLWIVILLVCRDIVLLVEGRVMIALMHKLVSVSYVGKFATAFLLFGFSFLLLEAPYVGGLGLAELSWLPGFGAQPALLGVYLVYIGTVLSLTVFVMYNVKGWGAYCRYRREQAAARA